MNLNMPVPLVIWAISSLILIGASWANLSVRLKVIEDMLIAKDFVSRKEFDELKETLNRKGVI